MPAARSDVEVARRGSLRTYGQGFVVARRSARAATWPSSCHAFFKAGGWSYGLLKQTRARHEPHPSAPAPLASGERVPMRTGWQVKSQWQCPRFEDV